MFVKNQSLTRGFKCLVKLCHAHVVFADDVVLFCFVIGIGHGFVAFDQCEGYFVGMADRHGKLSFVFASWKFVFFDDKVLIIRYDKCGNRQCNNHTENAH